MSEEPPLNVDALKCENAKHHLLIRQKMIDAAEGRLVGVVEEFDKAFDILGKYEKTVSIFGSARVVKDSPIYLRAFAVAWALAKHDFAIVTGGGHGVMEAANHGAKKAGGVSIGFNIELPTEQSLNPYTTESYSFEHFFGRKVALTLDASGYIFCGGGFGTLDELFEIMTLEQTGMIPKAPIILMGKDFWRPLDHFIRQTLAEAHNTINPEDTSLYHITDNIEEIVGVVSDYSDKHYSTS
ncbi:MAG: hypothetical protein JWO61_387 [Candidatus Saccharibacteria bacterium]|nr:hypothetical protein [Candidatus Saccharibacteria bacterium]